MPEQTEEFSFKNYFPPFTVTKALHYLVLIGILIFFNGLFNGFVGDDQLQVTQNS